MTLSPFGTVKEMKRIVSLNNKLTHSYIFPPKDLIYFENFFR